MTFLKSSLAIFFFIFSSLAFAQGNLPVIDFQISENEIDPYIKKLGISDENAIIVRYRVTNAWIMEATESYLVLFYDGRMFRYAAKNVIDRQCFTQDWVIKKAEITDASEKQRFSKLLSSIKEIDRGQLNLTVKDIPSQEENVIEQEAMSISDANDYIFEIYNKDLKSVFNSYAPEEYIELKYNGFEMRQKFIDIVKEFDFQKEFFDE